ncbi:MAG: peptide amidase, partial [Gammaproteobacteria bacterium]
MSFEIEETTVADIHAAIASGELSASALVAAYLERIAAWMSATVVSSISNDIGRAPRWAYWVAWSG